MNHCLTLRLSVSCCAVVNKTCIYAICCHCILHSARTVLSKLSCHFCKSFGIDLQASSRTFQSSLNVGCLLFHSRTRSSYIASVMLRCFCMMFLNLSFSLLIMLWVPWNISLSSSFSLMEGEDREFSSRFKCFFPPLILVVVTKHSSLYGLYLSKPTFLDS